MNGSSRPGEDEPTRPLEPGDEPTRALPPEGQPEGQPGDEPTRALPPEAQPEGDGARRLFADRDLGVAIGAGVLLVGLLIGTVLLSRVAFSLLVGALVVVGVIESARAFREAGVGVSVPVLVVASAVILVGTHRAGHAGQAVGLVTLLVGAFVWELTDTERVDVVQRVGTTVLLGLWVPFLGSYALLLHARPQTGWVAVLATVGATAFADVGAYFIGSRFGRRKLAPQVSPGKTWEGVLGGVLLAAVVAAAILPLLGEPVLFTAGSAALFAALVAGASVIGDLSESMVKRDLGVKDLGGIIPGHGGVLDRVDAILLALPVGYYLVDVLAG